jgi:putative transposase
LTGLRDRGLDTTRAILVGLDGGKALHAAVTAVFAHPVIQRCQLHKIRNVADKLPDQLAATVTSRIRAAYHADSALVAEAHLEALAKQLDRTHPGAAGSLREGLAETLTVLRLAVSPSLARTLRSTNSRRVDDLHRPHPLQQRQELAQRHHGTALVRRRHDPSPQPVPPRQQPPPPTRTTHRTGTPRPDRESHSRVQH